MPLTPLQADYLATKPLGRLATVAANGSPHVSPCGFRDSPARDVIYIGDHAMRTTKRFRNVAATGRAAIVVDDLVSHHPWQVRGVEIRGRAEALRDQEPL